MNFLPLSMHKISNNVSHSQLKVDRIILMVRYSFLVEHQRDIVFSLCPYIKLAIMLNIANLKLTR